MDYRDTLNLPRTDFPMKANLKEKEEQIQKFWEENKIYEKILEKNRNRPKAILHDGPPYANGEPHIGTAFGKVLKDMVNRFNLFTGFYAYFKPGWDCHGQPIELKALDELNINDLSKIDKLTIRKKCEEFALKYVDLQRSLFKRFGIFADWDNAYLTLSRDYEAKVIEMFKLLYEKGYIYRALKPIYWCKSCKTALAEAEVEYSNLPSPSIYVLFPFTAKSINTLENLLNKTIKRCGIVIWTTTPWTLPGNLAVTLHPEFNYVLVKTILDNESCYLLLVKDLVEIVFGKLNLKIEEVIDLKTSWLDNLEYIHPIESHLNGKILFDDYVSREEGTGCVHTAPGHGEEDYYTGLKYGLKPYSPVNEEGKFQGTVDWLNGKDVFIAQDEIVEFLKNKNILLLKEDIQHSYPTCWRCKNALIYRATYQWFLNVDKDSLRQKLLDATETVEWIPQWGKTRISNMIKNRPHWCLSRQRSWGVPLPIFYCNKCGHYLTNVEIIERIRKLFSQYGSNIWFEKDEKFLLEKEYNCQICGSQDFTKGLDIFDVWFESGVSWFAVLPDDPRLSYPCNYYLEGNDQHRGWFQVSLIPSVAINNIPPYKTVLTHGFIITEQGEKISKSADTGKIFSSSYLLKEYGADILRLAVLAWNAPDDLPISRKYLDQVASNYVKIRNTFRFMLANLYDFNPQNHSIEYKNFSFVDKVFYNKMIETLRMIEQHRRQYQFHKIYSLVTNFIIVELSALYFDIVKEKLYTLSSDALSRRSTQNVLWQLLRNFTIALAPVIPHTAEEIYSFSPHKSYPSVHLESWFNVETQDIDRKLLEDWDKIVKVRNEVNKILEELRSKKIIGRSREAEIEIKIKDNSFHQFLNSIHDELADIFLVSKVTFYLDSSLSSDYLIFAKKSDAPKCARCWLHTHSVGKNPRHPTICEKCLSIIEKLTR